MASSINVMKKEALDRLKNFEDSIRKVPIVLESIRLTGHYEYLMLDTIKECWDACLDDSNCNSISFLHGNRKPHYQRSICFMYASANPTFTTTDQQFFTSLIKIFLIVSTICIAFADIVCILRLQICSFLLFFQ